MRISILMHRDPRRPAMENSARLSLQKNIFSLSSPTTGLDTCRGEHVLRPAQRSIRAFLVNRTLEGNGVAAQRWTIRGIDQALICEVQQLSLQTGLSLGEVTSRAIRNGMHQTQQELLPEQVLDDEFRALGSVLEILKKPLLDCRERCGTATVPKE